MVDFTILAVTGDAKWLRRMQPDWQALGRTRFIVAASMDEACDLLADSGARLILLDWNSEGVSCETLDRLLWINTTVSRPALVVVISELYQAELGRTLFQMGVDEYLSLKEHSGQVQHTLLQLLPRVAEAGQELVKGLADSEPSITAVVPPAKPAHKVAIASTA